MPVMIIADLAAFATICGILFPRATSQVAACRHLETAARVKYPAAL